MFYLPIRIKWTTAQEAAGSFQNFSASLRAYVCRTDQDSTW